MRRMISIIGDAVIDPNSKKYEDAFNMGKALIDAGYRVATGGLGGVMDAAYMGARASKNYREGDTVAILPVYERDVVSNADVIISTGLDVYRNVIVANSDAVIAVGGGAGTLTEMANAWALKRLMIAFNNVEGWSSKVADTRLDGRIRYEDIPEDRVYGVSTAEQAIELVNKYIERYQAPHSYITRHDK